MRTEVAMDDLNDPRISAYRRQRRILLPAPPGPHHRTSKAERERRARANARATRMHQVGLTNGAVLAMAVVLALVVVMLIVVLAVRH
jgi:hypothetical protein